MSKASARRSVLLALVLATSLSPTVFAVNQSNVIADQLNTDQMIDAINQAAIQQPSKPTVPVAVAKKPTLAKREKSLPTPRVFKPKSVAVVTVRETKIVLPQPVVNRTGPCLWVSAVQAVQWVQERNYAKRVADDLSAQSGTQLANLPAGTYYCANTDTHVLAAAATKSEALGLSQNRDRAFRAIAGQTLSQTLTRWAEESGYQISWLSTHDYVIQFPYTFYGSLTASHGALEQILSTFGGDAFPLKAEVTQNHVLLIEDNEYSPSIVNID